MERLITVLEVLVPIAMAMALGVGARRRQSIPPAGVAGMQKFALNFALPFAMFNSCLKGSFSQETLLPMGMTFLVLVSSVTIAFRLRKKVGYSNFPMSFAACEAGLLGLPLYMILFPAEHAFRFAGLQLAHLITAVPTMSILGAEQDGDALTGKILVKKIFTMPLFLGALLGVIMNFAGGMALLESVGLDSILLKATNFMSAPINAIILFVIGYTIDFSGEDLRAAFRFCGIRIVLFTLFGLMIQAALCYIPNVAPETRWAVLLYYTLPTPYTMPPLGKNEREQSFGSGMCSIGTVFTMLAFCVITVLTR